MALSHGQLRALVREAKARKQKKGRYPAQSKIEAAGHEMKQNPPKILAHTARKFGKADADKQRIAIMLSKARRGR